MERTPFRKGRSLADHLREANGQPNLSGREFARLGIAQLTQLATKRIPIQGFLHTCLLHIADALAKLLRHKELWAAPIRKAYDDIRLLLQQANAQARVYDRTWTPPPNPAAYKWRQYLTRMIGPSPDGMYDPHAHHILTDAGHVFASEYVRPSASSADSGRHLSETLPRGRIFIRRNRHPFPLAFRSF